MIIPPEATKPNQSDIALSYSFEYDILSANKDHEVLLMASLQAPELMTDDSQSERAPLDIVCVIDKSGSMSGKKIELVRKTLTFMVGQLKPTDRIALVSFDSTVSTPLDLTRLNSNANKSKAVDAISKLNPGNCTNLSGGVFEGYSVLRRRKEFNEVSSILLFTDGLANEGITNTEKIVQGIANVTEGMERKPSLFTFGFGSDHDATMLTTISDAGSGMYYYVANEDAIPNAFGDALGGLVSVVAQNIKLSIAMIAPGSETIKILSTLRDAKLESQSVKINIGDIYSEENKDIVVNVRVPKCTPTDSVEVAHITLEYFSTIDNNFHNTTLVAKVSRPENTPADLKPNAALDMQRNRLISAEALLNARNLGEAGELQRARAIVSETISIIKQSLSSNEAFCQGLISDLGQCRDTLSDQHQYRSVGSKMINNYWNSNVHQRSAGGEKSAAQNVYLKKGRSAMKKKFSFL